MTVGIFLTNGIEAIVLCDEMVTIGGRQSASVTKMGDLVTDNYSGVLIGAGDGNTLFGAISTYERKELPKTLDACVEEVRRYMAAKIERDDKQWLDEQLANSMTRASILTPDETVRYIAFERERIFQAFDGRKQMQSRNPSTQILIAAYDKTAQKIRSFIVADNHSYELYIPHLEIGSGSDSAQLYFLENLQGLDPKRMDVGELAYGAGCAYLKSTLNVGVGGTPRVAILTPNGVVKLSSYKSAFLTNVCGYSLIGDLSVETMNDAIRAIVGVGEDETIFPSILENGYRAASYEGQPSSVIDLVHSLGVVADEVKTSPGKLFSAALPYSVFLQMSQVHRRT